jgi:hypothetical protein
VLETCDVSGSKLNSLGVQLGRWTGAEKQSTLVP